MGKGECRERELMAAFTKAQGKEKDVPTNVISVYMHVVEDVIENVRADFQSDGVDDAVLIELQAVCLLLSLLPFSLLLSPSALWEKKHVPQLTWGSA